MTTKIIEYTKEGRVLLPVNVKPLSSLVLMPHVFKVDTGADISTISKRTLHRLGYSSDWIKNNKITDAKRNLIRAGDIDRSSACYIEMFSVNLYGVEFKNWPLYIRDDDTDFPNLLGLNMLNYFDYNFISSKGEFSIRRADSPRIQLPLLGRAEVCEIKADQMLDNIKIF